MIEITQDFINSLLEFKLLNDNSNKRIASLSSISEKQIGRLLKKKQGERIHQGTLEKLLLCKEFDEIYKKRIQVDKYREKYIKNKSEWFTLCLDDMEKLSAPELQELLKCMKIILAKRKDGYYSESK